MCKYRYGFWQRYPRVTFVIHYKQLTFPGMLRLQVTSMSLVSVLHHNYRLSFTFVVIIVYSLLVYNLVYITKTSTADYIVIMYVTL